jgi:hypothetical protein
LNTGTKKGKVHGNDQESFQERSSDEDNSSLLERSSRGSAAMTPDRLVKREQSDRRDMTGSPAVEGASVESELEAGESCSADIESILERNRSLLSLIISLRALHRRALGTLMNIVAHRRKRKRSQRNNTHSKLHRLRALLHSTQSRTLNQVRSPIGVLTLAIGVLVHQPAGPFAAR